MKIGGIYKSNFINPKKSEVEIIELKNVFKCDMVIYKYILPENLAGTLGHNTLPYFKEIYNEKEG